MSEEHKQLADVIKECHKSLRELQKHHGFEEAWKQHLSDKNKLNKYADAMRKLSDIWENNSDSSGNSKSLAFSRIKWAVNYCLTYFDEGIFLKKRERELRQFIAWCPEDISSYKLNTMEIIPYESNFYVLDVGSCHNPFSHVPRFSVTAIDLNPASPDVLSGDFLNIDVEQFEATSASSEVIIENGMVRKLQRSYFHCVMFSLLLEYIPSSEQRLKCCRKAYDALRPEGILLIITPDSENVGKNAHLMKQWRYALASIGFMRVCFDKLAHITCMAFRKSLHETISQKWLEQQNLACPIERISIKIPQDS